MQQWTEIYIFSSGACLVKLLSTCNMYGVCKSAMNMCIEEAPVVRSADCARVHALGRAPVCVRAVRRGLHQAQLAQEARHDPPRAEALRL